MSISVSVTGTIYFLVIAGLDPAIHAASPVVRRVSMDHRVKPGGDDLRDRLPRLGRTCSGHPRLSSADERSVIRHFHPETRRITLSASRKALCEKDG
jgi:hypothetical protein